MTSIYSERLHLRDISVKREEIYPSIPHARSRNHEAKLKRASKKGITPVIGRIHIYYKAGSSVIDLWFVIPITLSFFTN